MRSLLLSLSLFCLAAWLQHTAVLAFGVGGGASGRRTTPFIRPSAASRRGGSSGGGYFAGGGGGGNINHNRPRSWNGDGDGDGSEDGMPGASLGLGVAFASAFSWKEFSWPRMPWDKPLPPPVPQHQEEEETVPTVVVQDVVVNGTQVLPKEVLNTASVESGLLGAPFDQKRLAACIRIINGWYNSQGYVLSTVAEASVFPNGAVVLQVQEPIVSQKEPISLVFIQKVNATDPESAYEQVPNNKGKTRACTVSRALGLRKGKPLQIDLKRFNSLRASPLFDVVALSGAKKAPGEDEQSATVVLMVSERRSVVFEPGITKTLFNAQWAGEVAFEDRNVAGLNYVVGVEARRGVGASHTSYRVRLGNDRFGRLGAWSAALFREPTSDSQPDHHSGQTLGQGVSRDVSMLYRSLRHMGRQQDEDDKREKKGGEAVTAVTAVTAPPSPVASASTSAAVGIRVRIKAAHKGRGQVIVTHINLFMNLKYDPALLRPLSTTAGTPGVIPLHVTKTGSDVTATIGSGDSPASAATLSTAPDTPAADVNGATVPNAAAAVSGDGEAVLGREDKGGESGAAAAAAAVVVPEIGTRSGFSLQTLWPIGRWSGTVVASYEELTSGDPTKPAEELVSCATDLRRSTALTRVWRRQSSVPTSTATGDSPPSNELSLENPDSRVITMAVLSGAVSVKRGALVDGWWLTSPFSQVGLTLTQLVPLWRPSPDPTAAPPSYLATLALKQRMLHSSEDTPAHQTTALGGQHTLRGHSEGSLGRIGSALLGTAELRFPMPFAVLGGLPVEGCVFVDAAHFDNKNHAVLGTAAPFAHNEVAAAAGTGLAGGGKWGDPLPPPQVVIQGG
ncbi:hypothetical protein JKP88DRAFT_263504 [Tribonema minus]|uniref:Bacterial surface antigen (D15) domain-containing protein n=1 Tax=Tribonema minus TaxID=303371 RepID=A0A835Z3Q2_9STRA|nr:hypothetical protein JKP88DRAFT_263504 [Tribonema minus]